MVGEPGLACALESVSAGFSDGGSASLVFVVGGDIADAGVQPDVVVERPAGFELV
jgi:hypothetical protein